MGLLEPSQPSAGDGNRTTSLPVLPGCANLNDIAAAKTPEGPLHHTGILTTGSKPRGDCSRLTFMAQEVPKLFRQDKLTCREKAPLSGAVLCSSKSTRRQYPMAPHVAESGVEAGAGFEPATSRRSVRSEITTLLPPFRPKAQAELLYRCIVKDQVFALPQGCGSFARRIIVWSLQFPNNFFPNFLRLGFLPG